MKVYDSKIISEVNTIIEGSKGDLVLISEDGVNYSIVNKKTHFIMLIDDYDIADLLIQRLKEANVEILISIQELDERYPNVIREKPMFWPEDKKWPPEK